MIIRDLVKTLKDINYTGDLIIYDQDNLRLKDEFCGCIYTKKIPSRLVNQEINDTWLEDDAICVEFEKGSYLSK